MKIIFLDVDGVLNDYNYIEKCAKKIQGDVFFNMEQIPFNPRSLKNLQKIVEETNSIIILTSTWRLMQSHMFVLRARLAEYGLKIDGITKDLGILKRGQEIQDFLNNNSLEKYYDHIENFIVIDDETKDIENIINRENIIKINPQNGLTNSKTKKCIEILKREVN